MSPTLHTIFEKFLLDEKKCLNQQLIQIKANQSIKKSRSNKNKKNIDQGYPSNHNKYWNFFVNFEKQYMIYYNSSIYLTFGNIILGLGVLTLIFLGIYRLGSHFDDKVPTYIQFTSIIIWVCFIGFFIFHILYVRIILIQVLFLGVLAMSQLTQLADSDSDIRIYLFISVSLLIFSVLIAFVYYLDKILQYFMHEVFSKVFIVLSLAIILIYVINLTPRKLENSTQFIKYMIYLILAIFLYQILLKLNQYANKNNASQIKLEIAHVNERIKLKDILYISFTPYPYTRKIYSLLWNIMIYLTPIIQTGGGIAIFALYFSPNDFQLFSKDVELYNRIRIHKTAKFLVQNTCILIACYFRNKVEKYYLGLIYNGLISSIWLGFLILGREKLVDKRLNRRIIKSQDLELQSIFIFSCICGLINICRRNKKIYASVLIIALISSLNSEIILSIFKNFDIKFSIHVSSLINLASCIAIALILCPQLLFLLSNIQYLKHSFINRDLISFGQSVNYLFFLFCEKTLFLTYSGYFTYTRSNLIPKEKSTITVAIIYIFESFIVLSLLLTVVSESNLRKNKLNNSFFKAIQNKVKTNDSIENKLKISKINSRIIYLLSIVIIPGSAIFSYFFLKKHKFDNYYIDDLIGGIGELIYISLGLGFGCLMISTLISLLKTSYMKYSWVFVASIWIIILIPYNTGFSVYLARISNHPGEMKQYYTYLLVYFSILLIISTSITSIIFNRFLFKIELEKKIKVMSFKLKIDLSSYFVFVSLEEIRTWLEYYFIHPQGKTESEIIEGAPIFWWEYGGDEKTSYKKEIVSKESFDELMNSLKSGKAGKEGSNDLEEGEFDDQENSQSLKKYLYQQSDQSQQYRGCLEKLFCINATNKQSEDIFHQEILKEEDGSLLEMLSDMKKDEIHENFEKTFESQKLRRRKVYINISKLIYRHMSSLPNSEFKGQLKNSIMFGNDDQLFYRKYPHQKIGQVLSTKFDDKTNTLWEVRSHIYYTILKRYPSERKFLLEVLFRSFSSQSNKPNFGNEDSMSFYDFNRFAKIIGLDKYLFKDRFNRGVKIFSIFHLRSLFMECSDTRRIFLSDNLGHGSISDVIKKATFIEMGLSFKAFLRFFSRLSTNVFLGLDRDINMPLTKFSLLLYELGMVFMEDYKLRVYSHNFSEDFSFREVEGKFKVAIRNNSLLLMEILISRNQKKGL